MVSATGDDAQPRTPETAAEGLLRFTWTRPHTDEIPLPVDPVRIARGLGIKVAQAALPARLAGSIVKAGGQDPVILLNEDDSRNRQRFTCAHELGHFVDHTSRGDEEFEYVYDRSPLSSSGISRSEIEANQFAAALLMPADEVRGRYHMGLRTLELARVFGVSADAMGYRLDNLGLKR